MIALSLVVATGSMASAKSFDTDSVRGRYTGPIELGANFSDGTTTQRLEAHLLTALTFDGQSGLAGTSSVTVAIPQQAPFTCAFAVTGSYQIGEDGLGSGTLTLAPTDVACGDGGGGVTLQVSLVVGGHNRRRLDVKVNVATDPNGEVLPLVGTGTLEK